MPWKLPKPNNAKDPHNWKRHQGEFTLIKLKPGEGLTTPMTEEQFVSRKVSVKYNEDW